LDGSPPQNSVETDSETALLLANIDSALRALGKTDNAEGAQKFLEHLELALHTYGSVKHLLPKLHLTANQRAPVERQLEALRAGILAHSSLPS
jgi:hypothetical protein